MPAEQKAETAIPTSANRPGANPSCHAARHTIANVAMAPNIAEIGIAATGALGIKIDTISANSPAPDVMPIISGPASGLRITPCSSSPLTARDAPARWQLKREIIADRTALAERNYLPAMLEKYPVS